MFVPSSEVRHQRTCPEPLIDNPFARPWRTAPSVVVRGVMKLVRKGVLVMVAPVSTITGNVQEVAKRADHVSKVVVLVATTLGQEA